METSSSTSSTENKKVIFDKIHIRQYERSLGDNPSVSCGPALTLGWNFNPDDSISCPLDEYETFREGCRRHKNEMVIPRPIREAILQKDCGYSRVELAKVVKQINSCKAQRRQTVTNLQHEKLEEKIEAMLSGFKRITCRQKLNEDLALEKLWDDAAKLNCSSNNNNNNNNSIHLYDSLSQTCKAIPVAIIPQNDSDNTNTTKGIAWYTCGPTVYDSAHLGHARTYVSLDILQRCLLHVHKLQCLTSKSSTTTSTSSTPLSPLAPMPIFIMNITNVDDKILARAKERNIPPLELAECYEQEFWIDMDALNVMRPSIVTRVTDHVECSIIPYIQRIVDNGMAYRILNDGVYFDVNKFEELMSVVYSGRTNRYGKLAPGRMETWFSWGMNQENGSKKKDPRDFVLWKNRGSASGSGSGTDGHGLNHDHEQQDLLWDSPWGKGRPGWHIECSAMIESTMQMDFMRDHYKLHVHAGGIDLKFPHHTNEIAQAEAYHYRRHNTQVGDGSDSNRDRQYEEMEEWIPHWVHTGHLHIDGLKMSKSLKNFITIRELLEEGEGNSESDGSGSFNLLHSPADDFRLWCLGLSGSYRGPATYSKSRLAEARVVREKIVRFLVDGEQWRRGMGAVSCLSWPTLNENDFDLMQQANKCQMTCLKIIFGLDEKNLDNSSSNTRNRHDHLDFDGNSYLNAIIDLSDAGNKYIAAKSTSTNATSTAAVVQALNVLREYLVIVGFSDKTVRAGILGYAGSGGGINHDEHNSQNGIFVDKLVNFRKAVRELALEQVKRRRGQSEDADMHHNADMAKNLLTLCDKLRDEDLPKVGIEIFDSVGQDSMSDWRFIIPRDMQHRDDTTTNDSPESSQNHRGQVTNTITESNFFKVARYEGQFSAFDVHGFPTHDADGVELSKRMIKKLLKFSTST